MNTSIRCLVLVGALLAACGSTVAPTDGSASEAGDATTAEAGDAASNDAAAIDSATDAMASSGTLIDQLYRSCVAGTVCGTNPNNYSLCVGFGGLIAEIVLSNYPGPVSDRLRANLACTDNARTCAEAGQCTAGGLDPSYCATHPGQSCDGARTVDCAAAIGGYPIVNDCAPFGETCGVDAFGDAVCTDGNACSADGGSVGSGTCMGTRDIQCAGGLETAEDCAAYGAGTTCSATATTTACVPANSATCSDSSGTRCDGNTVVGCSAGHELKIDCTLFQSHCVTSAAGDAGSDAGTQAQCEQDAHDCVDDGMLRCDGTQIVSCLAGRLRSVDCTTFGLRTCGTVTNDAGVSNATCIP